MDNTFTRRKKMLILHHFNGYLFTHTCVMCNSWNPVPENILRIAHFRKKVWKYDIVHYTKLLRYTQPLRNEIHRISV